MITIFTVPLPFEGPDRVAQRNAIGSWLQLEPRPEIILLGSEDGVAEYAAEVGVRHIPDIGVNELGNLSTSSIFEIGQSSASHDLVAFLDCDVILLSNFVETIAGIAERNQDFVLVGYRRNISGLGELSFDPGWQSRIHEAFGLRGQTFRRGAGGGSDYTVFRRGFYKTMPPFSIGKGHWDGWLMWYALDRGAALIDCTSVIFAIHQHHDHRDFRGHAGTDENLRLCGENVRWLHHATRRES